MEGSEHRNWIRRAHSTLSGKCRGEGTGLVKGKRDRNSQEFVKGLTREDFCLTEDGSGESKVTSSAVRAVHLQRSSVVG